MLKFSKKKKKNLVQKSKIYDEKLKNLLSTRIKYFPSNLFIDLFIW